MQYSGAISSLASRLRNAKVSPHHCKRFWVRVWLEQIFLIRKEGVYA